MFKAPKSSMSYPVSVCVLIYDVIITWFVTPLTWLFPPKALSALLSKSRSLAWRELKKYRSMRFFRTLSRYKTTRIYKEIKAVVSLKTRGTGGGAFVMLKGQGSRGGIPGRDPRQGCPSADLNWVFAWWNLHYIIQDLIVNTHVCWVWCFSIRNRLLLLF